MAEQETPAGKRLRIARLDLDNARAAVEALPTVEAVARARVEDARKQLDWAEAELVHVLEVEIPATKARVGEIESQIAELEAASEDE